MKCLQEDCLLWDGDHCTCDALGIDPEEVVE